MSQLVVLNLGRGSWSQGWNAVTAQLWQSNVAIPMQSTGSLRPAPELESLYKRWRRLYSALNGDQTRRKSNRSSDVISDNNSNHKSNLLIDPLSEFEVDEDDITNVSKSEFDACSLALRQQMNTWLSHDSFHGIDRKLRTLLVPSDEIQMVITTDVPAVLQFPWCLWNFFEDFPKAELALSLMNYTRSHPSGDRIKRAKVRILAVLGDSQGIDVTRDRDLLTQLPDAEVQFLVEPTRSQLSEHLWDAAQGWDILFFAGHSSSQERGEIQINPTTTLTIEQLKYGLKQAIAQGLKLAIFNSCDGLGLAWDLAELQIPQMIVMREPVPDRVAQVFLTQFLAAFSQGKSLFLAVREAKEKLQDIEETFPGASWLPVICQNPAEVSQHWQDWMVLPKPKRTLPTRLELKTLIFSSAIATGLVLGIRALGLLQAIELSAFDQSIKLRPASLPDSRLLVVTITEEDIQAQRDEPRKGSLSDRTLELLLGKLEQYEAAAIGLDLYRDFPVELNHPKLKKRLETSDRLVAICKRPDPVNDPTGIEPPPEVKRDRIGFSDFVEDHDGVLRRQLLLMSPNSISPCSTSQSFAVKLAFGYLNQNGIKASFSSIGNLQFDDRVYPKLSDRSSGYQSMDANGSQLLLNYGTAPRQVASQVTVSQILKGQINPSAVKNRIVIIGVTSSSSGDYWATPYGRGFADRVPGVFLQAQMVSQLVSAGLNQKPLLRVWTLGAEVLWVGGWAIGSGMLVLCLHRSPTQQIIAVTLLCGTVSGICFILLIAGWWVPLVPALCACVLTPLQLIFAMSRSSKLLKIVESSL